MKSRVVIDFVDEQRVVALTQQLVRISSQYSPDPGDNAREHHEITRCLADLYTSLGWEVHCAEPEDGYPVVVARIRGSRGAPVLAFIGHYNTQLIGDRSKWTVEPLGAEIRDGRIWGRGSGDMKKAIAATIEATRAVLASGAELKGDLLHAWFAGEGGHDSALEWMAGDGRDYTAANWYIDTDGSPRIAKLAAPLVWCQLRTRGLGGHPTAFLEDGRKPVNAVNKMVTLLARVIQVDEWMTYAPHPLYDAPWRTSPKPIIDVTRIWGGAFDQVPDECTGQLSVNLLPGQSAEGFLRGLREVIDRLRAEDPEFEQVEIEVIRTFHHDRPWELTEEHPVVKAIHEVATPILGQKPPFYGYNSGVRPPLWKVGEVITFGVPGGDKAHAPDESTSIEGLIKGTNVYAALIERLLT